MQRKIKQIAVLGSGVMGSRIACLFASIGVKTLLLDIVPKDLSSSATIKEKNKIVNDALENAIKSNPSPLYVKEQARNIVTGNFDDDFSKIKDCDWVIEAVVERLDVKKSVYEKVEQYRQPGTLITTNTSGIPIHLLIEGRSDDFKKHFCGTHFFNPPRYLRLLEIIPTNETEKSVTDFLMHYGDLVLGKTTVLCKDTPAFIANRIGVFSIMAIMHLMEELQLSIDEVDALTGPIIGRPKSATFRTADVVGIDTLVKVANGVYENCTDDEQRDLFKIPGWLQRMVDENKLGDKAKQGFFKKSVSPEGERIISTLNLTSFEYQPKAKVKMASIETAKSVEDIATRLKMLVAVTDKAGSFYTRFHFALFSYISHRVPSVSDELYKIDDAMKTGFGWEIGAFESWDALGLVATVKAMQQNGIAVSPWVLEMLENGLTSFYKIENGRKKYYDIVTKQYVSLPGEHVFLVMKNFENATLWKNAACRTYHLGDDVLGLEWYTKMGSIGGEVLEGIQRSIALAEQKYKGLVIANPGQNFSAGANVGMIFMLAIEQDYDEIDMAIRMFQKTVMRCRYSSIPVVLAPHGLTLGGACEMSLHADKVIAAAETYTGLVEAGIGVIPGGAGTKEFVLRASDEIHAGEVDTLTLQNRFLTIATAKVATSAHEAYQLGVYRQGNDIVSINPDRRIYLAKEAVIDLYDRGYVMPVERNDIKVLGRSALGTLLAGINGMHQAKYATDHDVTVAKKLAYVMCGGDLSAATTVSESYLLDLEREAFLSLCGERKTLERIQSVLKTGKPLRN